MKSKNYDIFKYLMISYVEAVLKIWVGFAILSLTCLQIEIFAKKNQKVEKDVVRFGVRVTIEFGFDFKIFSVANGQYKLLHINFGKFFGTDW